MRPAPPTAGRVIFQFRDTKGGLGYANDTPRRGGMNDETFHSETEGGLVFQKAGREAAVASDGGEPFLLGALKRGLVTSL